ncbi:acetylglutamate kinase [Candidatus Aerophobetes bacterium]|uniref:Acetylglutamate kinase n=1 Tax=Aerophobetes bacterium TaxID=2030807 RepID=A0A497E2U0_UNCAE|nr:MAG: acetylglutamate kinase [Candidatus Aerophobetes bacterium]
MEKDLKRAQTLVEALPYIRKFFGKTIVIKYGGKAWKDEDLKRNIAEDIVLMRYVGIKPVVVHGGGEAITAMMKKLNIKPRFIDGNRVTDADTMEVVEMVLVGKVNKEIVSTLNQLGGKAIGLEGKDGGLILARRVKEEKLGLVGEIEEINPSSIQVLEREGFIPVIAPVGVSREGETLNINADVVAAGIAKSLKAEKLIFLTDVKGILEDVSDENSLISTLSIEKMNELMRKGKIQKGMMTKVRACEEALRGGVNKVHIISGKIPHSLLLEIFTDRGIGTQVVC